MLLLHLRWSLRRVARYDRLRKTTSDLRSWRCHRRSYLLRRPLRWRPLLRRRSRSRGRRALPEPASRPRRAAASHPSCAPPRGGEAGGGREPAQLWRLRRGGDAPRSGRGSSGRWRSGRRRASPRGGCWRSDCRPLLHVPLPGYGWSSRRGGRRRKASCWRGGRRLQGVVGGAGAGGGGLLTLLPSPSPSTNFAKVETASASILLLGICSSVL